MKNCRSCVKIVDICVESWRSLKFLCDGFKLIVNFRFSLLLCKEDVEPGVIPLPGKITTIPDVRAAPGMRPLLQSHWQRCSSQSKANGETVSEDKL